MVVDGCHSTIGALSQVEITTGWDLCRRSVCADINPDVVPRGVVLLQVSGIRVVGGSFGSGNMHHVTCMVLGVVLTCNVGPILQRPT